MEDYPRPDDIDFRNLPEGASSSGYVEKLISFLEKYLPNITSESNLQSVQSENDITEQLYLHLTRKAKFNEEAIEYDFVFQPEKNQKKKGQKGHPKRMDIATRLNTVDSNLEVIYCLEAKKLPTPGSGREREYVLGKKGGIERFKTEVHGLDDAGNLIERNGIVAYVSERDFEHWFRSINSWIQDCGWGESEYLSKVFFGSIGRLTSRHTRTSKNRLSLDHFWVNV